MSIKYERGDFFPNKKKISSDSIAALLKTNYLKSRISNKFIISDISSLNNLKEKSILFISKNKSKFQSKISNKICLITDDINLFNSQLFINIILVKNLNSSFISVANCLFYHEDNKEFNDEFIIQNNSYVSKFAKVDTTSIIQNNCLIGRGVRIGRNCIIKNGTTIKNSIIGDNVIIGENSTIGSTGFGFDLADMGSLNIIPQIGIVIIDNNVRIGSNCTIDRGKIDFTSIGKNSMLDNQIHVAHNVNIGTNVCIAAQTGISGSVKIGNNVIIGGQTGFAGHIEIGDNVVIAAKSGVTKNIKNNSVVAGFPAIDIKEWKKNIINIKKYGHK